MQFAPSLSVLIRLRSQALLALQWDGVTALCMHLVYQSTQAGQDDDPPRQEAVQVLVRSQAHGLLLITWRRLCLDSYAVVLHYSPCPLSTTAHVSGMRQGSLKSRSCTLDPNPNLPLHYQWRLELVCRLKGTLIRDTGFWKAVAAA